MLHERRATQVRYPAALKPRRATFLARSVDVAPTLLDFAGLLGKRAFDGVSLMNALVDRKATTGTTLYYRYYDEAMKARVTPPAPPSHVGIRTAQWKLILFDGLRCTPGFRTSGPIFALYDLERDPREATDVYASTSTKIISKLKRELRAAMALYGGESHVKAGAHLPPDCLQLVGSRVPLPLRHRRFGPPQDFGTPDFVECLRATPCETPVMIAADSAKARRERIAAARVKSLARVKSRPRPGAGALIAAKHPAAAYLPRGQALAHIRAAAEAVAQKHAGRGGGWRPSNS